MKDKSVGIIPIYKDGRSYQFLLIHQVVGHWGFPKGHPCPGETGLMSAKRELCEETGICKCKILDNFKYKQKYSFEKNNLIIDKQVIFFLGMVSSKKKLSKKIDKNEIQSFKWLTFDNAINQLTYKESKDALRKAIVYLKKMPLNI